MLVQRDFKQLKSEFELLDEESKEEVAAIFKTDVEEVEELMEDRRNMNLYLEDFTENEKNMHKDNHMNLYSKKF